MSLVPLSNISKTYIFSHYKSFSIIVWWRLSFWNLLLCLILFFFCLLIIRYKGGTLQANFQRLYEVLILHSFIFVHTIISHHYKIPLYGRDKSIKSNFVSIYIPADTTYEFYVFCPIIASAFSRMRVFFINIICCKQFQALKSCLYV